MHHLPLLALLALVSPALFCAAWAQTVIDGNRFKIDDRTYRLWAMDAPDLPQLCRREWPAGELAAQALADLLRGKTVTCEEKGRNQLAEVVAFCRADGQDVASAMVRSGMAWADLAVSRQYVVDEARSTAAYLGVHAHQCKTAWDWRAKYGVERQFRRQEGGIDPPQGAVPRSE